MVDWEANENGARLFAGDGYHDGAHAYFVYARPYEPRPGALGSYLLVARDDGQHLVAFRVDWSTSCSLASVAITDTTFATAVNISNGRLRESRPIRARFDDPADEWATPAAPRAVINDHVVRTFTSETTTLYQGGVSARFHRYGPTGEVNEVGVGRDIASATVAGDTVFLSSFETSGWQLDLVREGETALETFFVPPDGADAWTEATDGVDFIWEQLVGDGPEYDSVEIWASRFTTVPSEFEPRRVMVHPVPAQSPHGVGFGRIWAGQVAGASFRVAVQALDGTDRRVWTPPPERSLYNEAMLGPEEMGLWIDFVRGDQGSEALRFYRFDALPVLE